MLFFYQIIYDHTEKCNHKRLYVWRRAATFQGLPMLIGFDFNMTLEAMDRPNNAGGQDPDSEDFRSFIIKATLLEMELVNYVYRWRSTNYCTMPS